MNSDPFDLILHKLAAVPDVDRSLGTFVKMTGAYATVNVGDKSVDIPCPGWYPPVANMAVQLERRNGQLVVTGPSATLNPIGTIAAGGSPKCTVTVDGQNYLLYYRTGYTPTIGDPVEINWATGVVQGKVTGTTADPPPAQNPGGGGGTFTDLVIFAADSGSYNGGWWTNDVINGDNNTSGWFYQAPLRDSLRGKNVGKIEIFLNPRETSGYAPQVGLHNSWGKPAGAPSVHDQIALEPRSGWVTLPAWWGNWLRDNDGGIGVTASGYTVWRGTASDRYSGALRFAGIK